MSEPARLSLVQAAPAVALDLWKLEGAKLDPLAFAQGMALLAASDRKEISPQVTAAFWLALGGEFDTPDFVAGVKLALQRERFLTVAAVFEACEAAREDRQRAEAREHEREAQRQAVAREHAASVQREARRRELEAIVAAWTAPPTTAVETLDRMRILAELEWPWVLMLLKRAKASWSAGGGLELRGVPAWSAVFLEGRNLRLDALAERVAGRPLTVAFRLDDTESFGAQA